MKSTGRRIKGEVMPAGNTREGSRGERGCVRARGPGHVFVFN